MLAVDLPDPPKGYVALFHMGRSAWNKKTDHGALVAVFWPRAVADKVVVMPVDGGAYAATERNVPAGEYRYGRVAEVLTGTRALVDFGAGRLVEVNPEAVAIKPETGGRQPAAEDHAQLLPGLEAWAGKKTRRKSAKDKAGEAGGGRR